MSKLTNLGEIMLNMLMAGKKVKSLTPTGPSAFRIMCYSSQSGNAIGVWEFELYDANGVNLCRNPGTVPTASFSPEAAKSPLVDPVNYPASNAIDGNYSSWPFTAYANCNPNGSAFIMFDFPVHVDVKSWRIIFEGNFVPTATGIELQQWVNGTWKKVNGTMSPASGYIRDQWYTFTGLSVA